MILASALLLAGGYMAYTAVQNSVLIQCVLAHSTEDMAEGEDGGGRGRSVCANQYDPTGGNAVYRCGDCTWVKGTATQSKGYCKY